MNNCGLHDGSLSLEETRRESAGIRFIIHQEHPDAFDIQARSDQRKRALRLL